MPKTLIISRLSSNKQKPRIEPELNNAKSTLPPNLQNFEEK